MARNRITWGGATLAVLLITGILAGCGGGGSSTTAATDPAPTAAGATGAAPTQVAATEPSPDGALLNTVLARQEAAVDAFAAVGPALPPRLARMAAYFRAQEQEHVDAVLKALRGLKAPAEPASEPIDTSGLESEADRLSFLYEVESATINEELSAISRLEAPWPRSLLASTVADQAQHLTLLRQALGAGPLASVPVPFENGTAPPPGE
ncbi:MAG: ferritin-like domain-containing protein [Actinobacteria bacterium]|nr:ferritin-like domain-containing protein [Actinomycetota bacterium]